MNMFKMPRMGKAEYDRLVEEQCVCRIAFKGETHPYIAPFLYVFDGKFIYFLSTKYGRKIEYFRDNPNVCVEIERYTPDLSSFSFVALPGRLIEVEDAEQARRARERFVQLILDRGLSPNILSALGHSPDEPVDSLLSEERSSVWKLVGVKVEAILGLKGQHS